MVTNVAWTFSVTDVAESSSDLARKAVLDGAPTGTGFLVEEQTAGRGRRGRRWLSPKGGMYLSVIIRPYIDKRHWPLLSFVAGLGARATIEHALRGCVPLVRWPNDILVDGRKICGILLENVADALIIGIGVNVAPLSPDVAITGHLKPVSLADLGNHMTSPESLAAAYMDNLAERYDSFCKDGFAATREEWMMYAAFLNEQVRAVEQGVAGRFSTIDDDGSMILVDVHGKAHHITTGDVVLMDESD